MGTRGDDRLFGEGLLASSPEELTAEELRRTLHHLQIETRALREALERTARHAHDADPSTSHVADFERCPHPVCRQARAMLPAGSTLGGAIPEPQDIRRLGTVDRRPRIRDDEDATDLEGLGGVADATGFERSDDDEDVEPSWIPLDRSPAPPPPRRPAPKPDVPAAGPIEAPATTAPVEPAAREPAPSPATVAPEAPPEEPREESRPAEESSRPWATPMPPPPEARTEEPPIPSHLFDAPPRPERAERPAPAPPQAEAQAVDREILPPGVARHTPPDKDAGIADAAADAIDRLARALFGPKRRR